MENVLSYYENIEGKFPIAAYLIDFSMGLNPDASEINWLYTKGYSTIPHAIRRCKRVSPTEKIILEEIYMSMGFKLESVMTRKTIASLLDIGVDTVRDNIKKLEEKKFLEIGEYNERYFYFVKSLSLNPYIIMSEFTHYAKGNYEANLPKSICDRGIQVRIDRIVKGEEYIEYIHNLIKDRSYSNIFLVRDRYFRYIEETVKRENKVNITIR